MINHKNQFEKAIDLANDLLLFSTLDTDKHPPLDFIFNGERYHKHYDGLYHRFPLNVELEPSNSLGIITIDQAKDLFYGCTYRKAIVLCTNNVNVK